MTTELDFLRAERDAFTACIAKLEQHRRMVDMELANAPVRILDCAECEAPTTRITKLERLPAPQEVTGWVPKILFSPEYTTKPDGGYYLWSLRTHGTPGDPQFVRVRIIEAVEKKE